MQTRLPKQIAILITVALSAAGSYAVQCYSYSQNCVCATPGQCYASCTPNECNVPTCIIATDYGYMDNVCPVASGGQYGARVSLVQASICFVAGCKIYNSCTQAYEYPACGCNFQVPRYAGSGSCEH